MEATKVVVLIQEIGNQKKQSEIAEIGYKLMLLGLVLRSFADKRLRFVCILLRFLGILSYLFLVFFALFAEVLGSSLFFMRSSDLRSR